MAEIEALFANHVLPNAEVRVAEVEGRVTGFIAWTPGEIDHLYIHPDCQGRGVGTALLLEALKDCDPGVELWVFQKNRDAIRFYEKHGFRLLYETDGQENMEKEPDARYGREPSDTPSPSGKGG